jgi:hypothetical protein
MGPQRPGYMRLGVAFNQQWLYQLERMVLGNTKPSICCVCHGWRMIALLPAGILYYFLNS